MRLCLYKIPCGVLSHLMYTRYASRLTKKKKEEEEKFTHDQVQDLEYRFGL